MTRSPLLRITAIPSLPASLLLVSASIGFIVLAGVAVLALVPIVFVLGGLLVWLVSTSLIGWAGIEALAACERWMEDHPRFQR
jgi:hypothetical protein